MYLSDSNDEVLQVAKENYERNSVQADTVYSDLYGSFASEEFDLIAVHPPAVPYPVGKDWGMSKGMRFATHGGADGSTLVTRSISESSRCLKPEGKFLLLLPHWSNIKKAWEELRKWYAEVKEITKTKVDFFPVNEGRPNKELIQHVKELSEQGIIEMDFQRESVTSFVSVIEGTKK